MKVLKFGGSSVASAERILQVIKILEAYKKGGVEFTVVFSAFGGVTDTIINMAELASQGKLEYHSVMNEFKNRHTETAKTLLRGENLDKTYRALEVSFNELSDLLHGVFLVKELTARTLDYMLSFGERNAAYTISKALIDNGIPADYLDARKLVKTDSKFGAAKVDFSQTNPNIQHHFEKNKNVQIITGFIGSSQDNITTTLGRGGSDYTVSIFGAALNASEIEIWTDVDGVMTADPRKVKKAFSIESMSYYEAMEMSHFGAKVIYPPTLQPALDKKIPICIKNTFKPDFAGTKIGEYNNPTDHPIKGVTSISSVNLLTLEGSGLVGVKGTAARLFNTLAAAGVNIILITQGSSEYSINFAIKPGETAIAQSAIDKEFELEMRANYIKPLVIERGLSVVAVIGENMRYQPGIAGRLFQALGKNGVNIVAIAQGSSELNISTVINRYNENKALNAIHEAFFLSDTRTLHVFMVGVGLIGSTLLEQIRRQEAYLSKEQSLEIKIVGLANSKKMLHVEEGLSLDKWKESLLVSEQSMEMDAFIEQMIKLNLRNTIFIDNTANSEIAKYYEKILDASISIVTPNKIATSSDFHQYLTLKQIARKRNASFLYETNVGAGLPVISTLNNLTASGDRIIKIEGVLSGSLSYIFNNFKVGTKFSAIVKEAQAKGFTEPDPREDLSGADVRRKLLILSREAGLAMEANDIIIKGILPQECLDAPSIAEFFASLEKNDDFFNNLLVEANKNDASLRFIACLDKGEATISLQEVAASNPFYSLSGSDNMIVYTTDRYKERPLVVRGPGAGAEVTAAGVFAEIISIGNLNK